MAIQYVQRPLAIKHTAGNTSTLTQQSGTTTDNRIAVHNTVTDNGAGGFIDGLGTVNYSAKTGTLKVVKFDRTTESYKSDHEKATSFEQAIGDGGASGSSDSTKGGEYGTASVSEEILAASTVVARYRVAPAVPVAKTATFTPPSVAIDLCPYTSDAIVPGSVRFTWMGADYEDFEGVLYRGRTVSNPGIASGTLDYATGIALMWDYVVSGSPTSFTLQSLWTRRSAWKTASIFMRTQAAPIKPTGFVLNLLDTQGNALTAIGDLSGNLTGTHMRGRMDYQTGVVELQFGDYVLDSALTAAQKAEWWYDATEVGAVEAGKIWRPWPVDPTTLRYNSVAYFYLPIDADILGLDPVRLPQDGRVPIFRVGSYVVVGHTGSVGPTTLSNGNVVDCARERLSRVRLVGVDGAVIHTGYTADLDAGLVTVVDNTGWAQPVTVQHRIEDLVRVSDVQIDGTLTFTRQLSHDFPLGSIVSSAIMTGTLFARVSRLFDQQTWDQATWADAVDGDPAPATYNASLSPIEVTNLGALTERWVLRFTSSTAFQIIGEHVGNIGTGSTSVDCAPINPIAGVPYFTVRADGWGAGWAVGNIVRLNTVGAIYPFAAIRTVQQGPAAGIDYSFELLGRGDIDRPPSAP